MGSQGDTPRKPHHHLPPVGSKPNLEYEVAARRKEVFGARPTWVVGLVAGVIVLALVLWMATRL